MNNERKKHTIDWFIENYSYCWQKNGESLRSPDFTIDSLEGVTWVLEIYPRGFTDNEMGKISLFLTRKTLCVGPPVFPVTFELSVLSAEGSTLLSCTFDHAFKRGVGCGASYIAMREDELLIKRDDYLLNDNLHVRCKIWREELSIPPVTQITARTRIGTVQILFLHSVEDFSLLKPKEKKTIRIKSPSKKGLNLSSKLYFSEVRCYEGTIIAEVVPFRFHQILTRIKISLLDSSGEAIECADGDNRFDTAKKDIRKVPLTLTRQFILKRKSEYLPDDKLSLMYDCVFTIGIEFEKIERTVQNLPVVPWYQTRYKNLLAEKLSKCPKALEEFKELYFTQLLYDVKLKTTTKTFPAHKNVLCARSSVFKSMLTSSMTEKNTDCIQLDDLEDETVQQLLLFLYSDDLKQLKWESVIKLYYAADKYAIEKLKLMCSSFLAFNVSKSNVIELLVLAELHNDCDLRNLVEDFILEHEKEVYTSNDWNRLIEINPQLVIETMLLKYRRLKIR